MADQKKNRNILEVVLTKIQKVDSEGNITKRKNLTFDEIGSFLFDILKISPTDCLRFNYTTGRYDTKEVMFKPEVDISAFLGTYEYLEHEITTRRQRNNVTKVTFKNLPLNIPDEEIVNLVECYGKPVDYVVHYEKMNNNKNKGMVSGTRFIELELFSGASLNNFYWMEGPLPGDSGCRVTVLHPGQIQQCSNCLQLATMGCPGKGNGKACEALKTGRTTMTTYMEFLRVKHGYRSMKSKYFDQFPTLGGAGNYGITEIVEKPENGGDEDNFRMENDEIVPENDFLKDVEAKLVERGELPSKRLRLTQVKNKILEKVKTRKTCRRERRDSISSMSSLGSQGFKRSSSDLTGGDSSRMKSEVSSIPVKIQQ